MADSAIRTRTAAASLSLVRPAGLVVGLALAVAVATRLENLGVYTGSFDEGVRAEQLALMAAGYRPFRDIFASQGVLLLDLLYPFFALGGHTLAAVRLGVAVFSLVGLIGAYLAGSALAGRVAGALALLVLLLSPGYLQGSRLALAEVVSLAPALLALAAGLWYARAGTRWLALAACTLCAVALLSKPMVVPIVPAVGLALLGRGRAAWRDLLLGGALGAAVVAAAVLLMGPGGVYEQLVAYRGGAEQALKLRAAANVHLIRQALSSEGTGLVVAAAAGAVLLLLRSWRLALPPLAWLGATLGLLLVYNDLSGKHLVYLVPPLALLAGAGPAVGWLALREVVSRSPRVLALPGLAVLGIVAYALALPGVVKQDRAVIWPDVAATERQRDRHTELALVKAFRELAAPNDFVVSDNPLAAFEAGRLVPPWLADPSGTRIDAGSITAPALIAQMQRYQPRAVATWRGRTGKLDTYVKWLDAHYRLVATYADGAWRLYAAPDARSDL
jgi:hypothetical protein